MQRWNERLDQRLGDFAPLNRPINELALERLLDRYGIALVLDYPQILFERGAGMVFPARQHGHAPSYGGTPSDCLDYLAASARPAGRAWDEPALEIPAFRMQRMREAYRILDNLYAPVRPPPRPPNTPAPSRGYGQAPPSYRR